MQGSRVVEGGDINRREGARRERAGGDTAGGSDLRERDEDEAHKGSHQDEHRERRACSGAHAAAEPVELAAGTPHAQVRIFLVSGRGAAIRGVGGGVAIRGTGVGGVGGVGIGRFGGGAIGGGECSARADGTRAGSLAHKWQRDYPERYRRNRCQARQQVGICHP